MLRTVLLLETEPEKREGLLSEYLSRSILSGSRGFGWLGGEVSLDVDDDRVLCVTSLWPDLDAYQAWLASDERAAVLVSLEPYLQGVHGSTQMYEIAEASTLESRQIFRG